MTQSNTVVAKDPWVPQVGGRQPPKIVYVPGAPGFVAPETAQPKPALYRLVGDAPKSIDPIFPRTFPLFASPAVAFEIRKGEDLATIEPALPSSAFDSWLDLESYELLVEQHGKEDSGEVSGAHDELGAVAMGEVLQGRRERELGLPHWRGEDEVLLRQAEALGRSWGLSPVAIERVTGRAYAPRKSLLPCCEKSKELDVAKAEAAKVQAEQERVAEAARVEAARPRTFSERPDLTGVHVKKSRVRTGPEVAVFHGAHTLSLTPYDGGDLVGFEAIEGHELPAFDEDGVRTLRPDEVVPTMHPVLPPDIHSFLWTCERRLQFGKDLDFGLIAKSRLRCDDDTVAIVEAIAQRYQTRLTSDRGPTSIWWHRVAAELAVRGALCRPDVAAVILAKGCQRETDCRLPPKVTFPVSLGIAPFHELDRGPRTPQSTRTIDNPARPATLDAGFVAYFGDLCARAVAGSPGGVSAGALVPKLLETTFSKSSKKAKGQ